MTVNETKNELNDVETAEVVEQKGFSIIWFIPLIALIFGAWLGVKAISEQGQFITIEFEAGHGIVPNKTEVRYKGLVTGIVKSVEPSEDLEHVNVEVEMSSKLSPYLTENTLFWLVTADISLQGVSGLETLLSGDYINIQPDMSKEGDSASEFVALSSSPPLDIEKPGLHLTLETDVLGSVSKNSPISFKQIPIGYVSDYHYVENTQKIAINVYIEEEYAHLIKKNSQFWNASGVQIVASLSAGIKVNTDSLSSIISGGIAVSNPLYQTASDVAEQGEHFKLYEDFQAAEMGHEIELVLSWNSGIDRGAAILYQGLSIGVVEEFTLIDPVERRLVAKAKVDPRVVPYLTDESQFFIVAPTIDLSGVSNAQTLLKGTYLSIRPSLAGKPQTSFAVYDVRPPYKYNEPGLHLVLETNDRASLKSGSAIYYKQQPVGTIQAIESSDADLHLVHIHIQEEFQDYVTAESHFWDVSGIEITGNLQGLSLKAKSLQTILSGGIAFDRGHVISGTVNKTNEAETKPITVKNGDKFRLFSNKQTAQQRVMLTLKVPTGQHIPPNTRVKFRGADIGSVHQIDDDGQMDTLTLGLLPQYHYILNEETQFWLVEPSITLSGLADTDALLGGAYITFDTTGNEQSAAQSTFSLAITPPEKPAHAKGLQLILTAKHATAASVGSAISYRGITIGQVDNMRLNTEADEIDIHITIHEEFQHLVNVHSRFYNGGGITVVGSLSKFVVKTESVDAVLRGGIALYNPHNGAANESDTNESSLLAAQEKQAFILFENLSSADNAGLSITIDFDDVRGLKEGNAVKYHQQDIGVIQQLLFNDNLTRVTAVVMLNKQGMQFAVSGSEFWLTQPEIGLVGLKHVADILSGGFIEVLPGSGERQLAFKALNSPGVIKQLSTGLNVKLVSGSRGSIRVGNPILYRQVKVGEVIGVGLADTANQVEIFININASYAALVTGESQFWNTSGITIDAGLLDGINIQSESLETLFSGGIAFATPNAVQDNEGVKSVVEGHEFKLNETLDDEWLEWQPIINIGEQ